MCVCVCVCVCVVGGSRLCKLKASSERQAEKITSAAEEAERTVASALSPLPLQSLEDRGAEVGGNGGQWRAGGATSQRRCVLRSLQTSMRPASKKLYAGKTR